ncbi:MAG: extracellular solute-binding protein [Gammaproteobacteria bacterium]
MKHYLLTFGIALILPALALFNTKATADPSKSALSKLAKAVPGVAMHGEPKYGPDFTHFDYVNPNAPKGGILKLGALGTFDGFNPFIPTGVPAAGLNSFIYQTLMIQSDDEAFSMYGLIAEKIEIAPDRSGVSFYLRPEARFDDGSPITAEDVVYSFNTLIASGHPSYQHYYAGVASVSTPQAQKVTFTFKPGDNRELPLILGQLPILSKKYWTDAHFEEQGLNIPVGNGPYQIDSFEPGRRIVYKRNPNYWGKDLPVNRGRYNFDTIIYEYFLEPTIALEAFKAGTFHYRSENNSKMWATQYTGKPFDAGKIRIENLEHDIPVGMQGFAFNLRKPLFQDPVLRQAMAYAFDFEWSNKSLFYGQYTRTRSYFQNTELAATGLPSPAERAILDPLKDQLPPEVFTTAYEPPKTHGEGRSRQQLRHGIGLLKKAGYTIQDGQLLTPAGQPVTFEFMLYQGGGFERIVLPFKKNLSVMGIGVTVRTVDVTQYTERLRNFDFDMFVYSIGQSLSPGNEQRDLWTSAAADKPGSRNLIGLKDPAVDRLVEELIRATTREDLINHCRALDRVLQWQHLVIPNWHVSHHRIAYWEHLQHPKTTPKYGFDLWSWWQKPNSTAP